MNALYTYNMYAYLQTANIQLCINVYIWYRSPQALYLNVLTIIAIREVTGVTVFCGPVKLINQIKCNAIWNVRIHS